MEIIRSIQAERIDERDAAVVMPQEEVDQYVDDADPGVVECRERNRHPFPTLAEIRQQGLRFEGQDEETGLLIRRDICRCCDLAIRTQLWDVRHHRGRVTRCDLVASKVSYRRKIVDGKVVSYTAPPGHGKILPKRVKNALATSVLGGQSYRDILKEAKAAQKR
jgi:hypothetical protein